jgi:hypothetical protein
MSKYDLKELERSIARVAELKLAKDLHAANAEVERLKAIVANLPVTADGVPMVDGSKVIEERTKDGGKTWFYVDAEVYAVSRHGVKVAYLNADGTRDVPEWWNACMMGRNPFYSTREAALAAKGASK